MAAANINGVNLNYTVQGDGDWVVLIGGFQSGNWQAWGNVLARLSSRFKLLAFDNRGIGGSDVPEGLYTTRAMAADTSGLMDHVGVKNAHILGKSMGGMISQWLVLDRPDLVRSVAMTSTFARVDARFRTNMHFWQKCIDTVGPEQLFYGMLPYFFTAEYFDKNADRIAAMVETLLKVNRPRKGFANTGLGILAHDTMDRLGEIRAPVLVMCGMEDICTPPRHSQELASRIPGAELRLVPGAAHGILTEKPEELDTIMAFFNRH